MIEETPTTWQSYVKSYGCNQHEFAKDRAITAMLEHVSISLKDILLPNRLPKHCDRLAERVSNIIHTDIDIVYKELYVIAEGILASSTVEAARPDLQRFMERICLLEAFNRTSQSSADELTNQLAPVLYNAAHDSLTKVAETLSETEREKRRREDYLRERSR